MFFFYVCDMKLDELGKIGQIIFIDKEIRVDNQFRS